ncbi:hypothetical protein PsYK624_054040 [Phanerochaete sordida]|uniref:Uncharacterized protein n=1 Tax=Phanerochaete sordida TaxID=48140 RepID=A0A9P3LCX1_9APHY|nr:hypothetical protein PsYK624_054040 [Phanerochaete sordida]
MAPGFSDHENERKLPRRCPSPDTGHARFGSSARNDDGVSLVIALTRIQDRDLVKHGRGAREVSLSSTSSGCHI